MSGSQRSSLDRAIFQPHEQRELTRRERRELARHPHRRNRRRLVVLLVALAMLAGAAFGAYTFVRPIYDSLTAPKDFAGPGSGSVEVVVNPGDAGMAIARSLVAAGVVKTTGAFIDATNTDPLKARSIQPGVYTLKKGMRAMDAFVVLTDPANRSVPHVTLPEGLWASEAFARLSKATGVPLAEYTKAAKAPASLGLPAVAKGRLDGYLFPSTYEFPVKATAADQLRTIVRKALDELDKAGVTEAKMQRTLTVASIVEGEVSGDADRGKVARVIENRLLPSNDVTFGLLQMDSTVHYAVHKRGKVGTTASERGSSSPYNTYKVKGLPPGPINSPGAASIEAAVHPTPGPWLFFVTVNPDTGETKFATTHAEHDRYAAEFTAWCRANPGSC
jgi:peptidoglycan lytic transglycosylase G